MKVLALVIGVALCSFGAFTSAADEPPSRDCNAPGVSLIGVPLVWKPTSEIVEKNGSVLVLVPGSATDSPEPSAPVEISLLADGRKVTARIGISDRSNKFNHCAWSVTTPDDVAAWSTDRMRFVLRELGLNVVDAGGAVKLSGRLLTFFVNEDSVYNGQVRIRIDARTADGKPVWSGIATGTCARFGRTYKLENYYEALSDALIDAAQRLTNNPSFRQAVAWR